MLLVTTDRDLCPVPDSMLLASDVWDRGLDINQLMQERNSIVRILLGRASNVKALRYLLVYRVHLSALSCRKLLDYFLTLSSTYVPGTMIERGIRFRKTEDKAKVPGTARNASTRGSRSAELQLSRYIAESRLLSCPKCVQAIRTPTLGGGRLRMKRWRGC